ncbi:molybdopterin-binding protein [Litorimonas sp. RW-G-Af-16]|uniref:molybdopterin-binding protein n=1 Tax=Litorimonas sp. RW-G-Af-16 TaxID=3241168 RepID=UPI003AAE1744
MSDHTVTAGIILIGDELLSGRTQDTNLSTIAKWLEPLGVQVGEARIIADDAEVITQTVHTFSERFNYVFTTGGIGPTHDDITADCIAAAFDLGISERDDAIAMLRERYEQGELNAAPPPHGANSRRREPDQEPCQPSTRVSDAQRLYDGGRPVDHARHAA